MKRKLKLEQFLNKYCNEHASFGYTLLFSIIILFIFVIIGSLFLENSELLFYILFILGIICYFIPHFLYYFFEDKKFCNMCHKWHFGRFINTKVIVKETGLASTCLADEGYYLYKDKRKICWDCHKQKEEQNDSTKTI